MSIYGSIGGLVLAITMLMGSVQATAAEDPAAALERASAASKSDAVLILRHGKPIFQYPATLPDVAMPLRSVTKSIVSLAVGLLIAEKKLPSLDAPLSTWFPEWREGERARVTLRHVMDQTSGLAHAAADGELMSQSDVLAYVRHLPLTTTPGKEFSYNNEAVNLLSGVIAAAAGIPVSRYLGERLFKPLGIAAWKWETDRAGHDLTHTGLSMRPADLAAVGQLLLERGRKTLPASWIDQVTAASTRNKGYGLLWWVFYAGRTSQPIGYYASGWLGQHLVVFPDLDIVAIRMRRGSVQPTEKENADFGMERFPWLARALAERP